MTGRRTGEPKGPRVVVRRLAGGRALRVDGSFASWYRPGRVTTGSVWDALAAPLAWLPPARRRSVLLLGLGGGSAARVARALAPRARIVGVEIDPEVVRAARESFDLDALGLEVIVDDAYSVLRRRRARFDVVMEDIFVGRGRHIHKPDWLPEPGLVLARKRLAPGGVVASNALDEAAEVGRTVTGLFPGAARIDVVDYDNRVFIGGPRGLTAHSLRAAVAADRVLAPSLGRLSFRSLRRGPRPGTAARFR